ncbi:replicative DNA helicase [Schlesneria sp. DSM 10557]|uniref:replicative DNA helicase n=1 Tax=Schlesneria sp. DSM 10557 TaxID=3044399 RepID=UPI00359F5391
MSEARTRRGAQKWQIPFEGGLIRADYAEKLLVGTLLVRFDELRDTITEFDLSALVGDAHRATLAAMIELADEQRPVDVLTVGDRLSETGKLGELPDGVNYLLELLDQAESFGAEHVAEWISIINSKASLRRLQRGLEDLLKLTESHASIEGVRSSLLRLAEDLPQVGCRREKLMSDVVHEYVDGLARGEAETMRVGIPAIDRAIGGVAPGELIIIGGRPGQGKSLSALQWVEQATMHGVPAMIVSEEMSAISLAKRTVQRIMPTDVNGWSADLERLKYEAQQHFAGRAPLLVAESCGSVDVAERAIASAVRRHGVKIVAVDYAQLLKGAGSSKYEQVSDVSTRMKRVATKHEIVVLLLAQLSRSIESRQSAVPQLSDLRDSGQLEQDADVILFIQWPAKVDPNYADPTEYRIYHAKNRSRGISQAVIQMTIDPVRQRLLGPEEQEVVW